VERKEKKVKLITVIDLFSGCGGLSLGLKSSQYGSSKFKFVASIDNDPKAVQSYIYNIPDANDNNVFCEDLVKFGPEKLSKRIGFKNVDVIVGGPPCPGFSVLGRSKIMGLVRKGKWNLSEERHAFIDDPRNKLFHEFVKYVDYFQPEIFLFENVKGLGSHKKRESGTVRDMIDVIKNEFALIGYETKSQVINSANYGVPQARERYFLVGTKNKNEFEYPIQTHYANSDQKGGNGQDGMFNHISSMQAIIDLPRFVGFVEEENLIKEDYEYQIEEVDKVYRKKYSNDVITLNTKSFLEMKSFLKIMRTNDVLKTKVANLEKVSCHIPRKINELGDREIFPLIKNERDYKFQYGDLQKNHKHLMRLGDGKSFSDKIRRIPWWKPSWRVVAHLALDGYLFLHPDTDQNRSITAREAARFQSFPDSFDFSANGIIAKTHQYRHIGNAVPPLVAKSFGIEILKYMNKKDDEN